MASGPFLAVTSIGAVAAESGVSRCMGATEGPSGSPSEPPATESLVSYPWASRAWMHCVLAPGLTDDPVNVEGVAR
jgi:hypothetical protein